jgi:hypothetical protein
MNGRTPFYLTLLAAAAAIAALYLVQPYSVGGGWRVYTRPAQRYLRAALHQDSLALVRQSASAGPVLWGLHAARAHPEALQMWARYGNAWTGWRRGDTALVLLQTASDVCGDEPIVLRFIGAGGSARVLQARSACFEREGERHHRPEWPSPAHR